MCTESYFERPERGERGRRMVVRVVKLDILPQDPSSRFKDIQVMVEYISPLWGDGVLTEGGGGGGCITVEVPKRNKQTWLKGRNPEGNGEVTRRLIKESQDLVHVLGKQLHRFARAYKL
ncbi:hypothetical protein C8J57DRAFT_1231097 [Mycena rebaudengoi]|nr:hypothetical protein C8J57DRAFT_1231097 [Mycena rebaudengoi]